LLAVRGAWEEFSRLWVTEDTVDANSLLQGEDVVYVHGPVHRNLAHGVGRIALAWLRNIVLAVRVVAATRPAAVLTTGGAAAVPFVWAARLGGARIVFVESLTRVHRPSLGYRLVAPATHRVYVQWPELREAVPRARYVGSVLDI
jgi:UDP-N-acetylglucosamine:LPS N-acetylglucosamine transferase